MLVDFLVCPDLINALTFRLYLSSLFGVCFSSCYLLWVLSVFFFLRLSGHVLPKVSILWITKLQFRKASTVQPDWVSCIFVQHINLVLHYNLTKYPYATSLQSRNISLCNTNLVLLVVGPSKTRLCMYATYGPKLCSDVAKNNWHIYTTYKRILMNLDVVKNNSHVFKQEGPKVTWYKQIKFSF